MERVRIKANLERTIAHSNELEGILGDEAFDIFTRARANLARHRKTGTHKVTQTKGRVDHYVNLEGPDALSVEYGHHHNKSYEWVEGLYILRDAIRGL